MPLWQDSAHPRVLRSGTAIAGALRPQRTISAADELISWHSDCLPLSQASNSGVPLPALGITDTQVSWHKECLPLPEASNAEEPLPALFPNLGEPLQSPQSEETMAIQQRSQATDSDIFNIHVEEYIIQEHNDEPVSSNGTVAWERHLRHTAHNLPCWPASKAHPRATSSANCIPHSPCYTESSFSPSPPFTFPHRICYTSSTQSAGARPPKTKTVSLHTHTRAH